MLNSCVMTYNRVASEILKYLKFPNIDGDDDPLQWWKFHKKDFPLLSQYARRYLAIPASSTPTERLSAKRDKLRFDNYANFHIFDIVDIFDFFFRYRYIEIFKYRNSLQWG